MSEIAQIVDKLVHFRTVSVGVVERPDLAPAVDRMLEIGNVLLTALEAECTNGEGNKPLKLEGGKDRPLYWRCSHSPPHCYSYETGEELECS
jgi:hypothetical protein